MEHIINGTDYIAYCEAQLTIVFLSIKNGKPDNQLKHRVEGLLLAGELLHHISKDEAKLLVERCHLSVFGESIAARLKRKKAQLDLKQSNPDQYFDIPTIERR